MLCDDLYRVLSVVLLHHIFQINLYSKYINQYALHIAIYQLESV